MSDISSETAIPKVIHYIWVGGKPLTSLAEHCLASWQTFLPDYEIKLWNEQNSPMDHHYVQAMYEKKKWAFVSDYIRFWVLEREGGIYLDTDMEVLKSFDELRIKTPLGFVGSSSSGQIESSIIAAPKGAPFLKAALAFYDTDREYSIADTSPLVLERAIEAQTFDLPKVYEYSHFHPCNEGKACSVAKLRLAYARHHWAESWVPYARVKKILRKIGIMPILKKVLGR